MRALLDTNVYVSRLLVKSRENSSVSQLIDAAMLNAYTLLVPEEVLDELRGLSAGKAYLRDRITAQDIADLVDVLAEIGIMLARQSDPIPAVLRDPKDDFLLTAAVLGDADYLVSGDRDLLAIRDQLDRPRIVTPREFLDILAYRPC